MAVESLARITDSHKPPTPVEELDKIVARLRTEALACLPLLCDSPLFGEAWSESDVLALLDACKSDVQRFDVVKAAHRWLLRLDNLGDRQALRWTTISTAISAMAFSTLKRS